MRGSNIVIRWPSGHLRAHLGSTPSAEALLRALPCESTANTWGEEVYFAVPVECPIESDARQVVDPGTVCLWVEGRSLALPFGRTPISRSGECRLVAKVNVLGKLDGDARALSSVRDGDSIRVERA